MFPILSLLYLSKEIRAIPLNSSFANSDISALVSPADNANIFQQRSIWDILWSCLATIFVCSWVSVHPNIPPVEERWWKVSLRRLELMAWSVGAPTMMILWAARQWIAARKLEKEYKARFPNSNWTRTHSYFIQMGGFVLYPHKGQKLSNIVLDPVRMEKFLERNLIEFPSIKEEEIKDRRRGDGLSKALVICQTMWFVIQCVARRVEGLPITQLELVTASLAFLNGAMYFLWWKKPLGVLYPVPVYALSHVPEDLWSESLHYEGKEGGKIDIRSSIFQGNILAPLFLRVKEMVDSSKPGSTFYAWTLFEEENRTAIFIDLAGLVFGAIHAAGWGFAFPTVAERIIWRASSAVIMSVPLLMIFISLCVRALKECSDLKKPPEHLTTPIRIAMSFIIPAYIICRLALLVEAFTTLRDLPPGAYQEIRWLAVLPHV